MKKAQQKTKRKILRKETMEQNTTRKQLKNISRKGAWTALRQDIYQRILSEEVMEQNATGKLTEKMHITRVNYGIP